jgi:hypothetical protein
MQQSKILSHKVPMPYGGCFAHIVKYLERGTYALSIHNPKKIRFYSPRYTPFPSWQLLKEEIRTVIQRYDSRISAKAAARAEEKALIPGILANYNVGDLLSCSWGWEQTNVEFVQIVGKSKARLIVRAIAGETTETQFMAGKCRPIPNSFIGPSFSLTVRAWGKDGAHGIRGSYVSDQGKIGSANSWSRTTATDDHHISWYA